MNKSNNAIEQELKKTCDEYSFSCARVSLLFLLSDSMQSAMDATDSNFSLNELKEITDMLYNFTQNLEDILENDSSCAEMMQRIEDARASLETIYAMITSYLYLCSKTLVVAKTEERLRELSNTQEPLVDFPNSLLLSLCEELLNSAENSEEFNQYASELLNALPFQMARQKFFDMIKNHMLSVFDQSISLDEAKNGLERIIKNTYPQSHSNYRKILTDIAFDLEEKSELRMESLEDASLSQTIDELMETQETLQEIENYLDLLNSSVCSAQILVFMKFSLEELFDHDLVYKDIYYTICSILKDGAKTEAFSDYIDSLDEKTEAVISPIIDNMIALNKKETALLKKLKKVENLANDTHLSILCASHLRSLFYASLTENTYDKNMAQDDTDMDKSDLETTIDDFIETNKKYLSKLTPKIRKQYMSSIFSSLLPFQHAEDLYDYIENSLQSISSQNQRALVCDNLLELFESYDISPFHTEMEDEWDLYDASHNHDCSCSHTGHTHPHDCGCDHENH